MSAEWDDLARHARAATPGPWLIRDEGQEVYTTALSDDLADTVAETLDTHDAEFIAAANPHTVQRLINELRKTRAQVAGVERLIEVTEKAAEQVGDVDTKSWLNAIVRTTRAALASDTGLPNGEPAREEADR